MCGANIRFGGKGLRTRVTCGSVVVVGAAATDFVETLNSPNGAA